MRFTLKQIAYFVAAAETGNEFLHPLGRDVNVVLRINNQDRNGDS